MGSGRILGLPTRKTLWLTPTPHALGQRIPETLRTNSPVLYILTRTGRMMEDLVPPHLWSLSGASVTCVQWQSEHSRNKQLLRFKSHAIPSSVLRSCGVPLCPAKDVNRPSARRLPAVDTPCPPVTQWPLGDQIDCHSISGCLLKSPLVLLNNATFSKLLLQYVVIVVLVHY